MPQQVLPKFGAICETANGFSRILPHEQSVSVQWLADGSVALSLAETGRESVVFAMSPQQAACLAAQLLAPAGIAGGDCQSITEVVVRDGAAQIVLGVDILREPASPAPLKMSSSNVENNDE